MDALTAALAGLEAATKGGPGSGNFGHSGRPGLVGGSQAQGGARPAPVTTPDLPDYVATPKLASEIGGQIPTRDGKRVPVATRTLYHVTKVENLPSLLKNGFDLTKVRPRWQNDYAVSTTNATLAKAMLWFVPNVAGTTFDPQKYAVVAVTVKGRFYDEYDQVGNGIRARDARDYTNQAVKAGWDGQDGNTVFIYNPRAISRIHVVGADEIAAANAKLKVRKIR